MTSRSDSRITVIDSHTGGEPTRVVVEGGPELGGGPLSEKREVFRREYNSFRSAVVNEPRGSDTLVGALLCAPCDPACAAGVIFFNNVGCLNMCVHGTIGLVVTLAHLNRIGPGEHRIETPVGTVTATLHPAWEGEAPAEPGLPSHTRSVDESSRPRLGRSLALPNRSLALPNRSLALPHRSLLSNRHRSPNGCSVTVANVPSCRTQAAVAVDVEGYGRVTGDVAWGGNWFFLVDDHRQSLELGNVEALTEFTWRIRQALEREGVTGEGGMEIDHVELFGPSPRGDCDSRNFVLCPGKAYDRSPCGTGTSAKLACLYADGKLAEGESWRQESIIGSVFEGRVQVVDGDIVPHVTGSAYLTAEATLILDPRDPFQMGIRG